MHTRRSALLEPHYSVYKTTSCSKVMFMQEPYTAEDVCSAMSSSGEVVITPANYPRKMTYEAILARSFSRSDQRRLQYGAIFLCLLVALSISTALKPYLGPLASCKFAFRSILLAQVIVRILDASPLSLVQ